MHIELTTFDNVFDKVPKKRVFTPEAIVSHFEYAPPLREEEKLEKGRVFSMTVYKPKTERSRENIHSMTGVVFDFDNDKEEVFTPLEEIVHSLKEKNIFFWWYTTVSNTEALPRWRLVIPFLNKVSLEQWEDVYEGCYKYIGSPPGVDPASKRSAALWRYPYQIKDKPLFKGKVEYGNLIDLKSIPISDHAEKKNIIKKKFHIDHNVKSSIQEALTYIDPDISREDWIKVGMSLHAELGDAGFEIWDHWSSYGSKYPSRRSKELQRDWNSFRKSGITIGTLFFMAKEKGFKVEDLSRSNIIALKSHGAVNLNDFLDEDDLACDISSWDDFASYDLFNLESFPFLHPLFEIFRYHSPKFRPILALSATIALGGFLLKHRYQCQKNLNFYNMLIASPGIGKDFIIGICQEVLISTDLFKYVTRDCETVQGFEKELERTKGSLFMIMDEAAEFFKMMKNKNISTHKQALLKAFKEIFSSKSYATRNTKGDEKKRYENPFVSLLLLGTPDIFSSISSFELTGGLLSRFLIFHERADDFGLSEEEIKIWEKKPTTISLDKFPINLQNKNLDVTDESSAYLDKFHQACLKKSRDSIGDDERTYILRRAKEIARKISFLTVQEEGIVRIEGMKWAVAVVVFCLRSTIELMDQHFGQSVFLKEKKKIQSIIEKLYYKNKSQRKELTKREVLRHSNLPIKIVDDIIYHLVTLGVISSTRTVNKNNTISDIIQYKGKPKGGI